MNKTDLAIQYAFQGFKVFPCNPDKSPLTRNGHKDASSDPEEVKSMFKKYEDKDVLIGSVVSGNFFVWDVDVNKKTNEIDYECFPKSGYPFLVSRTKSGGYHYYFRTDKTIKTKIKILKKDLDIKGNDEKGYIILPDDEEYTIIWQDDHKNSFEPSELDKMLSKCTPDSKKKKKKTKSYSVKEEYYSNKNKKAELKLQMKGWCKETFDAIYNDLGFQCRIAEKLVEKYGKEYVSLERVFIEGATETFRSLIHGHKDENPSTRFSRGTDENGYVTNTLIYIDYSNHLQVESQSESDVFACDLIHLFYHIKTNDFRNLTNYEKVVWAGKMLNDLGIRIGKIENKRRRFHMNGLKTKLKGFREALDMLSFRFCLNLDDYDDGTVPLSRKFLVEWCELSQPKARALLSFLIRTGQLKLEKMAGRIRIYKYVFSDRTLGSGFWRMVIESVWVSDYYQSENEEMAFCDEFKNFEEAELFDILDYYKHYVEYKE